jgi:two-component system sensor kinase FixL
MFLFLVPSILVAAALGGLVPGLVVTAVDTLVGAAVLARHGMMLGNHLDAFLFALLGVSVAMAGQRLIRLQNGAIDTARHLREREAYLQLVIDTVPDAMIIIDQLGIMQSFSHAAERLFGWTAAEVVGRNVSILMPSPDKEAHDGYLERYGRTGERRIIGTGRVVLAERKDGSTFPAALSVGELNLGGRRFFTGFLQDLTEREEAEKRLQSLQSELVHISRLSAMGEMAATLAHELNQPLSAISNYLKGGKRILETEHPDSRALAAMDKASEQSLRAGEIIRRLRDFVARGESERQVESLSKLLEEVSAMALIGAKELGVRATFRRDSSLDAVLVDKVQIQQVALNLIRNAIEAMQGEPRRELVVTTAADGDDYARVSVADTGHGIKPEIADQLFQPFVTTKGAAGMGVGLSICRTIIEAHGGRIWAEPNAGGGTTFAFTIPRAEIEETA